ncbi:MAG TPA: ATP-binding protein [Ktedonobacteraceae bacterium]|nr:ATP-binding protein [Ktedonobacteraceae bacterium]
MARLWDDIALTDMEKEVIAALRLIAPGTAGLNFVGNAASVAERTPIVKIASIAEPIPLRSMGDGMQRMLGVALALVNARDGLLLIDEIENGIHYAVQPDLWNSIFYLADQLNVQVLATTHSWDCLEGFKEATQRKKREGLLIRLENRKGRLVATILDEQRLNVITRERIEVR